jgi:hypothetical protein
MSDFPAGVIEFTVEPRPFTGSDDAVSLGPGFVPLNPRLVSFDSRGLSTRNRSVLDSGADAVLLALLALINLILR